MTVEDAEGVAIGEHANVLTVSTRCREERAQGEKN